MSQPTTMTSTTASTELLRRNLKTWEALHGRQLPAEALEAWVHAFGRTNYRVLERALEIVTANAERMPVPGMLTKAIDLATEEATHGTRPPAVDTPHISTLSPEARQEMKRLSLDLRKKLGMPEAYEPMTEAEAEEERQRQKNALAAHSGAPWAKQPPQPGRAPSDTAAATPAPATTTPREGT